MRERCLHAEKSFVERTGKEGIQQVLMNKSQPQDAPTEAKPGHKKHENASVDIATGLISQIRRWMCPSLNARLCLLSLNNKAN